MKLFPLKYFCTSCGDIPNDPQSMVCRCGGELKTDVSIGVPATTFEPHFCPTIKQYVTSWSDQEKKAKAFRSADHPEGFTLLQGNKRYMNHLKKIHKNKEEVRAAQYAKDGIKYPKGKQAFFNEQEGRFVNKVTKQPLDSRRYSIPSKPLRTSEKIIKAAVFVLGFMLIASSGFCKIEGVPYVTLKVNGTNYEVPLHQPDFTEPKAKIVMDMLDGDKSSRVIFLGGKEERIFFIGDGEKVRWLHVTENKEWVT